MSPEEGTFHGEKTAGTMASKEKRFLFFQQKNHKETSHQVVRNKTEVKLFFLAGDRTGKGPLLSFAWGQTFSKFLNQKNVKYAMNMIP